MDLGTTSAPSLAGTAEPLRERRQAITHELVTLGLRPTFEVLRTEWWSLYCEPRVVDDPRYADGEPLFWRAVTGASRTPAVECTG